MRRFVDLFGLWIVLVTALALIEPATFLWFKLAWINPLLCVIMIGMGLTLTWDDFARVGRAPLPILLGVFAQFVIMPLAGWGVGHLYGLSTPFAVGLILVACCPGGTASNVIAYVARADVALSVSMTTLSTLAAVAATPFLTAALAGSRVEVDALSLLMKMAWVVLLPVIGGLSLRTFAPRLTEKVLPVAPSIAVAAILAIVGGIVASQQKMILGSESLLVAAAVATVHGIGAALGYTAGKLITRLERVGRTVAIEVGMQNAGLAFALAKTPGAFPTAIIGQVMVPCVFSGITSCLLGSGLAAVWSRRPLQDMPRKQPVTSPIELSS